MNPAPGTYTVAVVFTLPDRGKTSTQWDLTREQADQLIPEFTNRFGPPILETISDATAIDTALAELRKRPGIIMTGRDGADQ